MEPQIRYVRSAEGTKIPLSTFGEGQPLVWMGSIGFSSMDLQWRLPSREGIERLAETRMVVRYDNRGQGLSAGESAIVAIAYAARNPAKVRRIVLVGGAARGSDFTASARTRAVRRLIEIDWEAYVRTVMMMNFGWTELGRRAAEASVGGVTPEAYVAAQRATREYDVTGLLPHLRCPALVVHLRGSPWVSLDVARRLAASLPNARLVQFDQEHPLILSGEAAAQIIEQFLDEDEPRAETASPLPSGTAIILFADIADSTALTERLGDAAFREKARDLD